MEVRLGEIEGFMQNKEIDEYLNYQLFTKVML